MFNQSTSMLKWLCHCAAASIVLSCPLHVRAQSALPEVVVTANPLKNADSVNAAAQLSGDSLRIRQTGSLGETLNSLPGVTSTYFGPHASRPILRGLDGDRVRVLNNSSASFDASALSFDHAVPVDPISLERIEVLRGPGALLYGGNAVGGVVNLIDRTIAREPVQGFKGIVDLNTASIGTGRHSAARVDAGNRRLAIHASMFNRSAAATKVPLSLVCESSGQTLQNKELCNSQSESDGAALGATTFFSMNNQMKGYFGLSGTSYNGQYGSVVEDLVSISMKQRRLNLESQLQLAGSSFIDSIKLLASRTRYEHTEFEDLSVGTVFNNKGSDLKITLLQKSQKIQLGQWSGLIGLQWDRNQFSADGDEAFAPYSRTNSTAVFVLQDIRTSWGGVNAGLRTERVSVDSLGNPELARFVATERKFSPASIALSADYIVKPGWNTTVTLSRNERAPKDYELYANGPHLATAAYELGDSQLKKEKSTHLELGLRWRGTGGSFTQAQVFTTKFSGYISLENTGQLFTDEEDPTQSLPIFAYTQQAAKMNGLELNGRVVFDPLLLDWRAEWLSTKNTVSGNRLPRIAPARFGVSLASKPGIWSGLIGVDHVAKSIDAATRAYSLWRVEAQYNQSFSIGSVSLFARLDNATNRLAYSPTSILTFTAPGRVPLPGRTLNIGARLSF